MALKNYSATSLTGGAAGALDSIDGTNLQDLDYAAVFTADKFYFYSLDDDSGAAESSPDIISPDANAGNKRWILVGSINQALLTTSSPTFANLTISTILTLANAGLHILDTNASHDLIIKPGSNLTADRILTIVTGDGARQITISGTDAIEFANAGVRIADSNASHHLTLKPGSDLSADREVTILTDDAARSLLTGTLANIWIPASSMVPLITNGAVIGENEYATNDVMVDYLAFDGATEQYAAFTLVMPESWNRSTIKAKFYWAPGDAACTAGDTVEFQLQGISVSDDGAMDDAFTDTGEVISDTVLAGKNGDLHITSTTPAITINGSPALSDLINLKVSRNVGGTDDMTEDAWLFGVMLQITMDKPITAWS